MRHAGIILIVSAGLWACGLTGCGDNSPPARLSDATAVTPGVLSNVDVGQELRFLDAYTRVGRPRLAVYLENTIKSPPGAEEVDVALSDWLSCDNQVGLIAPSTVPRALTQEQKTGLANGDMTDIGRRLKVDILIVAYWENIPATDNLALNAEAFNTKDSKVIASARVIVPMDQQGIDHSTRTIAGELMEGMGSSWQMMVAAGPPVPPGTPPLSPPEQPLPPGPPPAPTPPMPPNAPEQPIPPAPPMPPQVPITPPGTEPVPVPPPPFQPAPPVTPPTTRGALMP